MQVEESKKQGCVLPGPKRGEENGQEQFFKGSRAPLLPRGRLRPPEGGMHISLRPKGGFFPGCTYLQEWHQFAPINGKAIQNAKDGL